MTRPGRTLQGVLLLAGVVLLGAWLVVAPTPPMETAALAPARQPRSPGRLVAGGSPAASLARNVFEFADAPSGGASAPELSGRVLPVRRPIPTEKPPEPVAAPSEPAVRLVGVVLRGGQRKAALSIRGELSVIGVGESAEGYKVLAIDEESGVRLSGPEGELALTLPSGAERAN